MHEKALSLNPKRLVSAKHDGVSANRRIRSANAKQHKKRRLSKNNGPKICTYKIK